MWLAYSCVCMLVIYVMAREKKEKEKERDIQTTIIEKLIFFKKKVVRENREGKVHTC